MTRIQGNLGVESTHWDLRLHAGTCISQPSGANVVEHAASAWMLARASLAEFACSLHYSINQSFTNSASRRPRNATVNCSTKVTVCPNLEGGRVSRGMALPC